MQRRIPVRVFGAEWTLRRRGPRPPFGRFKEKGFLGKGGRFPLSGGNVERSETKGVGITGPYGYVVHGRRAGSSRPTKKGVYCTPQAQDKLVEASAPEIEESGSDNDPAPFKRPPAPAGTTWVSGVRPP